ncbi:M23 family metallopeptidase [Paenibacillus arenilitoris]|uniref:M23 family metallopeptidase n=1 Tax=Paenibacillus arenilitoris TaxID=2772299 RepID=A0A927CLF0_9BACL|nr:M23 family metallopeptidase [Paenibacillus arenilitoris]MBD2867790.1 M23 family metallopeptidase [Paenibacillus arenilitoris]
MRLKLTTIAATIAAASLLLASPAGTALASSRAPKTEAAAGPAAAKPNPLAEQKKLYDKLSAVTDIPWHWIAAIDQYERSMSRAKPKARPALGSTVGVFIDQEKWAGPLNPDAEDSMPASIRWFNGIGRDGDGNGQAERTNDFDLLYSLVSRIASYGVSDDDFSIGLWEYYQNSRAVQRIQQFSRIYAAFGELDLFEHAFPVPLSANYAYRSTWGTGRSWGGRRIHEGTDIFAGHGVPVRSTCYGIVEVKGWNPYGGWRIGIRDLNNFYHYYAHMSGYDKTVGIGDVVKPGQVVGWVGSSGYGKPGTQGKFPPHLHYGVYSDRGLIEWSFDPFPMLKRWEQEERKRLRAKK